jgi:hypothetical protein
MAAQLALEALGVGRVIAKINDPVRAEAYSHLGIPTLCRTNLMADAVFGFVGMPLSGTEPIMSAIGHHPGGEEHHAPTASATQAVPSGGGLITAREAY